MPFLRGSVCDVLWCLLLLCEVKLYSILKLITKTTSKKRGGILSHLLLFLFKMHVPSIKFEMWYYWAVPGWWMCSVANFHVWACCLEFRAHFPINAIVIEFQMRTLIPTERKWNNSCRGFSIAIIQEHCVIICFSEH